MYKQQLAREKAALIRRNSLKSFIEKALSETSLEYELEENLFYDAYASYSNSKLQYYIFKLRISLSKSITGIVSIPSSCTPAELKQFLDLEKTTGNKRIDSFTDICTANKYDFYIKYDSAKIYSDFEKKINKLDNGFFRIKSGGIFEQRMMFVLSFKNELLVSFRVYYDEREEFLKALKDFVKNYVKKEFSDYPELYECVEKSSLRNFWIITKKVLRLWVKDRKTSTIHLERLTRNLQRALFENNSRIEHIVLPDGMRVIPSRLFAGCVNLKSVMIPETVETIEKEAFMDCINLRFINFPDKLRKIGDKAFAYCDNLVGLPSYIPHCEVSDTAFLSDWGCNPNGVFDYDSYDNDSYDSIIDYSDEGNWY